MEKWIILGKFGLLVYCGIKYIESGMEGAARVIFFILIYIFFTMLYYILKPKLWKRIFVVVSAALLMYCFLNVNILFVFLLPMNIIDVIYMTESNIWFSLLTLLPLTIMPAGSWAEYMLIIIYSVLLNMLSNRVYTRINQLSLQNDELRNKIDAFTRKLNADEEFQKQMGYLLQLEERNRIAQQIHDRVGHTIAGSIIQLEAALLFIDRDREKAKSIISNIISVLKGGIESISTTLRNIKPPVEQLGINRIKSSLDEFSAANGIRTTLVYSGALECINQVQWKVIIDNMTEALTNALKHSKCTSITVSIHVFNKIIKAEIKDNGIGAANIKKGLGLQGIEERTANVGGKVIVDGSDGFSIITLLPVEEVKNGD